MVRVRTMKNAQHRYPAPSRAQTASELAVFGAILIFVLGLIIRHATSFNYYQNQSLEAMRLAFRQSFISGVQSNNASRVFANVLFIEDRKDVDITSSKFGPQARVPYIVSGSGSFTPHLFMGTDWGHPENLTKMDIYINGKHFTFTTAALKTILIDPADPASEIPDTAYWRDASDDPPCFRDLSGNPKGCYIFWAQITNSDRHFDDSCDCCFDLDRSNNSPFDPDACPAHFDVPVAPAAQRENFSWQWKEVKMTTRGINLQTGRNSRVDVDGDLKEETIMRMEDAFEFPCTVDEGCHASSYMTKKSSLIGAFFPLGPRIIHEVNYMDMQEGDLDFTYNGDVDTGPRPGLMEGSTIFSFVNGTYLSIEEGKLYGGGTQYIRDVQRQDRVDMIERVIQLSNDTGRFCSGGNPSAANPAVEACGSCEDDPNNRYVTCFDPATLKLYVRSKIEDIRGRKWITDVSKDEMLIE